MNSLQFLGEIKKLQIEFLGKINILGFIDLMTYDYLVGGIGALDKVVDSQSCGWSSIPGKICIFFHRNMHGSKYA